MKCIYTIALIAVIATPTMGANPIRLDTVPPQSPDAPTGTAFATQTAKLSGRERQRRAVSEIQKGNIPEFLRTLKPVRLTHKPDNADTLVAIIWVTPDYLAIGSTSDFLRFPLTYPSALAVANAFECILPTRKMVDAIYEQATCLLSPAPLPPGQQMRSNEYYLKHRQKIRDQRRKEHCTYDDLVAGHKKDVVLTNRLNKKPGRIAIYGWHQRNGRPIQPLSTVHGARYADYSHGIRLIYQTVYINDQPHLIFDVLKNPKLAPLLTYEGTIANPYALMGRKS